MEAIEFLNFEMKYEPLSLIVGFCSYAPGPGFAIIVVMNSNESSVKFDSYMGLWF